MLRLKTMSLEEIPAVVPLFLNESQTRFWEGGKRHDRESATEMLSGSFQLPSYHWMIYWESSIAGYGHLLRSDYLKAWIVSYMVAHKFQRLGIATAFVKEVKTFASNEGIESLYASVHPENVASIRVAEKAGFQLIKKPRQSRERLYRWNSQPED